MSSSNSKLAIGILGGVAAGALLGILFAPDKGSNTRKKIADKGKEYGDDLKGKYGDVLATVTEKYEKLFKQGESLLAETKSQYEELKAEGQSKYQELKAEGQSKFEDLKADGKAKLEDAKKDLGAAYKA